jgi:hypothetical protein
MNTNIYSHQNILINTNNKDSDLNLNNDLYIRFPNSLMIKESVYISLLDFNLNCEMSLFGNTNSSLTIEYTNDLGNLINTPIHIDFSSQNIRNDRELSIFLTNILNGITLNNYSCTFNVSQINVISIITNLNPEVDLSTTSYTITTTKPMSFYFNSKSSIGPILGFGTGVYLNQTNISGNSTQSINAYSSILSINDSANSGSVINYDDLNCKMLLYNSAGTYITNIDNHNNDATISINRSQQNTYYNIGDLLHDIETEMNRYSNRFTPAANFLITYDYKNHFVTITNTTGAKFGIGFDFFNQLNFTTAGSLHRILGFHQKTYKHITSITSEYKSKSFLNIFSDDYVLLCSDIINNTDTAVIGLSNNDNIFGSNILFAIRYDNHINFRPYDSDNYRISLKGSSIMINYKQQNYNNDNPCLINFYLRLLSGRHISSCTNWSSMLKLTF